MRPVVQQGLLGYRSGGCELHVWWCVQPDDTLVLCVPGGGRAVERGVGDERGAVAGGGAPRARWCRRRRRSPRTSAGAGADSRFGIAPGARRRRCRACRRVRIRTSRRLVAFNTETAKARRRECEEHVTYEPAGFAGDLVEHPGVLRRGRFCGGMSGPGAGGCHDVSCRSATWKPRLVPVYNLAPEPGEVAKIGFTVGAVQYEGDIAVRPPGEAGEYGGRSRSIT